MITTLLVNLYILLCKCYIARSRPLIDHFALHLSITPTIMHTNNFTKNPYILHPPLTKINAQNLSTFPHNLPTSTGPNPLASATSNKHRYSTSPTAAESCSLAHSFITYCVLFVGNSCAWSIRQAERRVLRDLQGALCGD